MSCPRQPLRPSHRPPSACSANSPPRAPRRPRANSPSRPTPTDLRPQSGLRPRRLGARGNLLVRRNDRHQRRSVANRLHRPRRGTGTWQPVNVASGNTEARMSTAARGALVFTEPQIGAWYALTGTQIRPLNPAATKSIGTAPITVAAYQDLVSSRYSDKLPGTHYSDQGTAGGYDPPLPLHRHRRRTPHRHLQRPHPPHHRRSGRLVLLWPSSLSAAVCGGGRQPPTDARPRPPHSRRAAGAARQRAGTRGIPVYQRRGRRGCWQRKAPTASSSAG